MMQSTTLAHAPTVDADADAAPERLTPRVLAERIAAALGGWRAAPNDEHRWYVELHPADRTDGYGVSVQRHDGRAVVSPCRPPRTADGWTYAPPYGETWPKITVRADRSADAIAREITRRLLPAYDAMWTRYLETRAAHEAYVGETADLRGRLAAALGVVPRGEALHVYTDAFYGDVQVSGSHARFTLSVQRPALAERLARLLAEAKVDGPATDGAAAGE